MTKTVLIVDDEIDMAVALEESLKRVGFLPTVFHNPVEALAKVSPRDFTLIITDMKMPKMSGIEFLQEIRSRGIFVPVIVITGFGTVQNAVEAMKLGATDYIMKPFSFDALCATIERIMPPEEPDIVAGSPVMQSILALAREVAKSDITVLLSGESGTGKEVVAKAIHRYSTRANRPFVAVNCAAISEHLLESELFGHEKGAFTGAVEKRIGKFELANSGTLLLDEVSEMAPLLQAKLLRALQEREIDRVGGKAPIQLDVRVISTTNRDLFADVKQGRFREDLYYRLNVFPISIPPLRERREDILPLANFFLQRLSQKMGRPFAFSAQLCDYLVRQPWEGNVRELENFVYRTAVVSGMNELQPPAAGHIPHAHSSSDSTAPRAAAAGTMRDMERDMIIRTLHETGGNRTHTAEQLGLSVRTIRNKMKEYAITDE
ncbi:MAG TPA: sigma-54 dependent transcriptional regulator, partial [Dissulfurispiraceae bacterium]|nr:sigma-54 dependent transcriptional regulator [Dissulfurispiraceae bacterium]